MRSPTFLLLFATTTQLSAQWTIEPSVPNSNVPALHVHGEDLFVGTDPGVFHTADATVPFAETADLPITPDYVDAICTFNGRIFAGTGTQGVLSSADDGASWQAFSNGLNGLGGNSIRAFAVFDGALYCATLGNGTFKLVGETWQHFGTLQNQVAANVNMLRAVGDTLWAGGGGNGYIWYTNSGATDWTPVLVAPITSNSHNITDIIRVPGGLVIGTSYGVYHSEDGGATWSPSTGIGPAENIRFAQWGDTLFAARNTAYSRLYASTDHGLTWALRETLSLIYAVAVYDDRLYTGRIDGLWYRSNATTKITDPEVAGDFRLWPVPASSEIFLERGKKSPSTVTILDMQGRAVMQVPINGDRERIAVEALSAGLYVLQLDGVFGQGRQPFVVE